MATKAATTAQLTIASVLDPLLVHALSYLYHGDFIGAMCSCHRLLSLCRTPRLWRSLNFYYHSEEAQERRHHLYRQKTRSELGLTPLTDERVSRWLTTTIQPQPMYHSGTIATAVTAISSGSGRFSSLRELHLHHNPSSDDIDGCHTLTALGSLPSLTTLYMGSGASLWNRPQFEALLGAAPNLLHLSIPSRLVGPTIWGPTAPRHLVTFDVRYRRIAMPTRYGYVLPTARSNYITQLCASFPKLQAVSLLDFSKCQADDFKPIAHQLTSIDVISDTSDSTDILH